MKFKLALHNQILIALILGAIFGAIFNVNQNKIIINYSSNNQIISEEIENWESFTIKRYDKDSLIASETYNSNDQIVIVKKLNSKTKLRTVIEIVKDNNTLTYNNIQSAQKEQTIATLIKPLGDLFIRLLSFIAIPLVLASLIVGASSLRDLAKLGRIGSRTFIIYLTTTALAITIGVLIANTLEPGKKVEPEAKNRLLGAYQEDSNEKLSEELNIDIINFLVEIVPKNPINAISSGNMLQIVFFALFFGISLTFIDEKYALPVVDVTNGINEAMIKMVHIIMKLAPYGVFALIAAVIADFGFSIVYTLIWYILAVVGGLLIQTVVVYGLLVKSFGKISIIKFFKEIRNAQAIGFSTSSSAATLPVTIDCVVNKMGKPKEIAGFVLPLGATINMDGTALYQGVAAIFISQIYGFDLSIAQQLTIIFTAVLASIGTAPVPGVGIIMLVIILQSVNVPAEGIAIIIGVDRILDMLRTITNVTGDAAVAVAISGMEEGK